jgi:F-type H+/Na+-transporting ATPase subunit alpha
LMKQPQYATLSVSEMAITLFAVNKGYLDDVEVTRGLAFESALKGYIRSKYASIIDRIETTKDLDAATEKELDAAIQDFKKNGTY